MDRQPTKLVTLPQAADRLHTSQESVRYYALRARSLPYVTIGRRMLFLEDDLADFVLARRRASASDAIDADQDASDLNPTSEAS